MQMLLNLVQSIAMLLEQAKTMGYEVFWTKMKSI